MTVFARAAKSFIEFIIQTIKGGDFMKHFLAILAGTIIGDLLWDRVIKPKMDEKDKNNDD